MTAMRDRSRIEKGEADLAALLLRTAVGGMLATHGINKVAGPGGLDGTTRWFAAGALLTVGAMSPLPVAATIGLMTTAASTDHKGKGFFVFKGGWEYTGVVAAAAAALGPGRWSLDARRGHRRQGWGLGCRCCRAWCRLSRGGRGHVIPARPYA
jgi:putative oxidoreductase